MIDKEFKVNNLIILKLHDGKTVIYVDGEKFQQCKAIFFKIPLKRITSLNEFESIDELTERIDELKTIDSNFITSEEEFWGHCSSLQMWAENNYDTNMIHSNLAFPLLAKLVQKGDQMAKNVFKKEVVKRLSSGFLPTILSLIGMGYTDDFDLYDYEVSFEEMQKVMNQEDLKLAIKEEGERSAGGGFLGNFERLELKYSIKPEELKIIKEIELHIGRFIAHSSDDTIKGPLIHIENNLVKILALDNINLSYVPESVSCLNNIENLRLNNNDLKEIPFSIGRMRKLKLLSLHYNLLNKLPESIKNLKNLETLILSGNKFTEIPLCIFSLEKLRVLLMNKNKLSSIPQELTLLKDLEYLYLSDNVIESILEFITELTSLKKLCIERNPIKEIPKSIIHLIKL